MSIDVGTQRQIIQNTLTGLENALFNAQVNLQIEQAVHEVDPSYDLGPYQLQVNKFQAGVDKAKELLGTLDEQSPPVVNA